MYGSTYVCTGYLRHSLYDPVFHVGIAGTMSVGASGGRISHTFDRKKIDIMKGASPRNRLLGRERAGSIDQLYTGKKVSKLPEDFTVKIGPRNVDLITDLVVNAETEQSLEPLRLKDKPQLSKKAWNRLSNKSRTRASASGGENSADGTLPKPEEVKAAGGRPMMPQAPLLVEERAAQTEEQTPRYSLMPPLNDPTRISMTSVDSGFSQPRGIADSPLTSGSMADGLRRQPPAPDPTSYLRVRKGMDSLRVGTKHHRKSMLLSELCVVTVTVPTEVAQGQKGRGAILKFRFSPYTQIEFLRVSILKVCLKPCISILLHV